MCSSLVMESIYFRAMAGRDLRTEYNILQHMLVN